MWQQEKALEMEFFPTIFLLSQNSPNPFNLVTTTQYAIPVNYSGQATLKVYNLRGALFRKLIDQISKPSMYSAIWNGTR